MEQRERALGLIMLIPQTIKEQLTKAPDTIEHWGVSEWLILSETTLALRVHARYLDGMVCIIWYEHTQLYGIEFFNNKSKKSLLNKPEHKYQVTGVYGNQLFEFIDQAIDKIPDPDGYELSNVDFSDLAPIKDGLRGEQRLAFNRFE